MKLGLVSALGDDGGKKDRDAGHDHVIGDERGRYGEEEAVGSVAAYKTPLENLTSFPETLADDDDDKKEEKPDNEFKVERGAKSSSGQVELDLLPPLFSEHQKRSDNESDHGGDENGAGGDVFCEFCEWIVVGRDEIHGCFNGGVEHFGHHDQGDGEEQNEHFAQAEPCQHSQEQDNEHHVKVETHMPLSSKGENHAIEGGFERAKNISAAKNAQAPTAS
jgi:hypothetical protein